MHCLGWDQPSLLPDFPLHFLEDSPVGQADLLVQTSCGRCFCTWTVLHHSLTSAQIFIYTDTCLANSVEGIQQSFEKLPAARRAEATEIPAGLKNLGRARVITYYKTTQMISHQHKNHQTRAMMSTKGTLSGLAVDVCNENIKQIENLPQVNLLQYQSWKNSLSTSHIHIHRCICTSDMYAYVYVYLDVYIEYTCIHTYIHTYVLPYVHAYICTCVGSGYASNTHARASEMQNEKHPKQVYLVYAIDVRLIHMLWSEPLIHKV